MDLELRIANFESSNPLEAHVVRKLEWAGKRFAGRIERVLVRLADMNGPKGGIDKRCRMAATLAGVPSIIVEATDADAYVAITRAAERLHQQVARALRRQKPTRGVLYDFVLRPEPEPEPA